MEDLIVQIVIGIIIIVIGRQNMKGNISSLHSYHRKRVKKEDVPSYGKRVGFGSIIIGISVIISGIFSFFSDLLMNVFCFYMSNVVITVGLIGGLIIIFCAMFKYNKGIF